MKNALVIGYGVAGQELEEILLQKGYHIIGFLDDTITHEKVIGTLDDISDILSQYSLDEVYFSIPSYTNKSQIYAFRSLCLQKNIGFKIVPGIVEIIDDEVDINFLRDVQVEDLIGRSIDKKNVHRIKDFIRGKHILVTGAGGTIGGELVKQLHLYGAGCIVGIDHSEIAIFEQHMYHQHHENVILLVGNILDTSRMQDILQTYSIDIVYNAAAYKHVYLMEKNPREAIKNNIFGLKNLLEVSVANHVSYFCQISTDKAVNPTSVMGATKRIGELLISQYYAHYPTTKFGTVRFGNVLGSSGSILHIFESQMKQGGPLTVTSKEVSRYFMTIYEAVNLVIASMTLDQNGKTFILDMGDPIYIYDLAKQYIDISGSHGTPIEIIGLRSGEKLHEELILDPQHDKKTSIDKIYITEDYGDTSDLFQKIDELGSMSDTGSILKKLQDIIPEFQHTLNET